MNEAVIIYFAATIIQNFVFMYLREALLKVHSKENALRIAGWVGRDALRFNDLVVLFLEAEYRVVQGASGVIGVVGMSYPEMIQPHLAKMVAHMHDKRQPVAVKRNVLRLLQKIDIPEELHGEVMNICFDLLADVHETIAVRAFSMTVLANLAHHYPDIKQELKILIEEGLNHEPSPGYKSRANRILASL